MRGKQVGNPVIHFHNFGLCKQAIYFQAKHRVTSMDWRNNISFQPCKYISYHQTQPHWCLWGPGPRGIASGRYALQCRRSRAPEYRCQQTQRQTKITVVFKECNVCIWDILTEEFCWKVTNYLDQINTEASHWQLRQLLCCMWHRGTPHMQCHSPSQEVFIWICLSVVYLMSILRHQTLAPSNWNSAHNPNN